VGPAEERTADEMSLLNPSETIGRVPDDIAWQTAPDAPPRSVEEAVLAGGK